MVPGAEQALALSLTILSFASTPAFPNLRAPSHPAPTANRALFNPSPTNTQHFPHQTTPALPKNPPTHLPPTCKPPTCHSPTYKPPTSTGVHLHVPTYKPPTYHPATHIPHTKPP